jgi:hypothetical protein
MTTIVTRQGKGSALTYEEMDSNLTNLKTDVESTQANVTAANARVAVIDANLGTVSTAVTALESNAAGQANQITGANAAIATANTALKNYVDGQVSTLTANAGTQQTTINTNTADITDLRANITAANAAIATKTTEGYVDSAISTAVNNLINSAPGTLDTLGEIAANLATNADTVGAIVNSITSTNANVTAANARIATLDANLGSATNNITTLFANAATQSTDISTLFSNAASQTTSLQVLDANLGTATTNITALQGNAGTQQTTINTHTSQIATLDANLGTATTNITTLFANAATQQTTLNGLGTIATQNANAVTITGGNVSVYNSTATNKFVGPHFDAANSAGGSLRNSGQTALIQWGAGGGTNIALNGATNINPANAQVSISPTGTGSVNIKPEGHLDISPTTVGFMNNVVIGNATPASGIFTTLQTSGNITANAGAYFVGDGSKLSGITAGTTYTDANVAAYLTAQNISSANIGGSQIYANTQIQAISANIGSFYTYANATYSTGGGSSYGNTNVAAYLAGSITVGNIASTNGYFWANGTAYSTGGASTYGNTQVAEYLPTYTGDLNGPLRSGNVYSTTNATVTGVTGVFVASGAGANVTITGESYLDLTGVSGVVFNNTPRIDVHDGNLNVYKNTSTNANGSIYADNNIRAGGNVIAPNFTFANGVNILSTVTGSGTYGNTEVDAYLNGSTSVVKNSTGTLTLTGNTASLILSATAVGGVGGPVVYAANSSNIGSQAGVYTTTGFFWANGVSYVNGDLAGNMFYDSVRNRTFANAYPLSTPDLTINNGGLAQFINYAPVYNSGVLAAPTSTNTNQTLAAVITGNVALRSSYQTSNNRTTSLNTNYLQVWMNTANTMTNSDRIRSGNFISEVRAVGQTWGGNTAQPTNTAIMGVSGVGMFTGNGTATSVVGLGGFAQYTPASGGIYSRMATGVIGSVNFNTGGTGRGPVYVETARCFGAFQSGASGNIVVNTAVGLHTHSGWATATTKYALLNEDTTTAIRTLGNIEFSGTNRGIKFNDGSFQTSAPAAGVYALSSTSQTASAGTVATLGNIQVAFSSSNVPQIGPVTGTLNYGVSLVKNLAGNITGATGSDTSISTLTDINNASAMTGFMDVTTAIINDQTGSRVYRATWTRTSTVSDGVSHIALERLS